MTYMPEDDDQTKLGGPQYQKLIERVDAVLSKGMKHGHFKFTVEGAVGKEHRREVVLDSGLTFKFTIPREELPD